MEATLTRKNLLLEGANSFLYEKPMLRQIQIRLLGTVPIQRTVVLCMGKPPWFSVIIFTNKKTFDTSCLLPCPLEDKTFPERYLLLKT